MLVSGTAKARRTGWFLSFTDTLAQSQNKIIMPILEDYKEKKNRKKATKLCKSDGLKADVRR